MMKTTSVYTRMHTHSTQRYHMYTIRNKETQKSGFSLTNNIHFKYFVPHKIRCKKSMSLNQPKLLANLKQLINP